MRILASLVGVFLVACGGGHAMPDAHGGGGGDGGGLHDAANLDASHDAGGGDAGLHDGGAIDGGAVDGGAIDGGAVDGGALDGGALDGGAMDGGAMDGGAMDGGALDGGMIGDANPGACNILAQTGCGAGEKCAWIVDQTSPTTLGHIGCAPDGTVAVGGACVYGPPGATGYDDCVAGTSCLSGVCKTICDQNGGAPACDATHTCQVYEGLFGPPGAEAAGVCDPTCNPLDDNDFDGSGPLTKTGSACGSGEGCFGFWDYTAPTHFSCARVLAGSTMLFHRSACTAANGCASAGNTPYLNGCAPGYMPLIADETGSSTYLCRAFCKPADCYAGNCGTADANQIGAAPHRCNTIDAAGTFTSPDATCVYGWLFEERVDGTVLSSPYSDTTGLCLEHADLRLYDQSGSVLSTTPWPECDTLPLTATSGGCYGSSAGVPADTSGCTAVDLGCVSTTTGGVTTTPAHHAARHRIGGLRLPYHRLRAR